MVNISAITICFNNFQDVINTCASVDAQESKPFEHLIIDGSTNTEIKSFLENSPQPNYRNWICERDNGIGDAFNKGIVNSKGNVLVMLNAGDTFFDDQTINIVSKLFEENSALQWLHGKYSLQRGGEQIIIGKPFEQEKLYRGMRSISHQTMFVKKELHTKYGLYDNSEKIGMDYDFLCRIANEQFFFVEKPLANFAPAGISSAQYLQSIKDIKRIYEKYHPKSFLLFVWQLRLRLLYYLLHSPIGNFLYGLKKKLKLENM